VPFHAGWSIAAVKNANWRYWTLLLHNPQTKAFEDFFLIAPLQGEGPPLLLAPICAECGVKATHLCGLCLSVGFCIEHGEESEHAVRGVCGEK
jgi:hypothetical protein